MKYWRGYLVAAILAAMTWAGVQFAKGHEVLIDMAYPYTTRLIISSMADWTGGMGFCLWQVLVVLMVIIALVTVVLMIVLRWNFVQWLGWVLAALTCVYTLHTGLYGLNDYASPLADDIRLEITDYTVSELNEATVYFRDKANELAAAVPRNDKGEPDFGSFEELAQQAGEGFETLAYERGMSVFAGSTVPVKELGFKGTFTMRRISGVTMPLTGEAAVNPDVPSAMLPFAMCKEMAYRMSISREADADFAAFLACTANSSQAFQYSGYLAAYKLCYDALASISTSTAQSCAQQTDSGVGDALRQDIEDYTRFFGKSKVSVPLNTGEQETTAATADPTDPTAESYGEEFVDIITYSQYEHGSQILTSWYIQEFIVPMHQEEEQPFNPLDPSQVDLSGIVNAKPAQ